jgi:PAS domain S-box-containing protein
VFAIQLEREAYELGYLSNDYLLYRESQQASRWESKFASFSNNLSNLKVGTREQQVLVDNIKTNQQRLKAVLDELKAALARTPQAQAPVPAPEFIQVFWSRMEVQNQGMIFDASRLTRMLREQEDQLRRVTSLLSFVLIGVFGAFLFSNYGLIFRQTLKAIADLQAGTRIIGSGNLDFAIAVQRDDEIGELSRAFNLMATNLKSVTASKTELEKEIAERKRAEQEIAGLARFPSENPNPVLRVEQNGLILYANAAAGPLLAEWNCKVDDPLPLFWRQRVADSFASQTRTEMDAQCGARVFSIMTAPIRAAGYINLYGIDITDRKRTEEALEVYAETLREQAELLDYAHVLIRDLDGRIVYWNMGMKKLYGWTGNEAIGQVTHTLFQTQFPESLEAYQAQLFSQGYWEGELVRTTRDGSRVVVASHQVMHRDSHDSPIRVLEVDNDITDLERAKEELRRSNAELEQFAYIASHDLQEPLRAVTGMVQLLQRRYQGRLDADADEFIGFAVEGTTRMQTLINDLLAFARVGTRAKRFERTDAATALQAALTNLAVAIHESGAVVTCDALPTVTADPSQLAQVFQNLIGNAIKFHGEAAPKVRVTTGTEDGETVFSVRDNGIGIDPQFQDRVFMIFQRLHTRDQYPGYGIGLSICQRIVERRGGRIWVQSQPGQGATFYFTIPL